MKKFVLVAAVLLIGVAVVRGLSKRRCGHWNTRDFMREATPETVAACLEAGAEIDAQGADGGTPLHLAASMGKPLVVSLLLEAGAELDARNSVGETSLFRALGATFKNDLAIAALLDAGADVSALGANGKVPIHVAASRQDEAIVGRLLGLGADPNAEGVLGRPLHYAARRYSMAPGIILALARAGADVNATGYNGNTPLHIAAWYGRSDDSHTTALLEAGAYVDARNDEDQTPLHQAVAGRNSVPLDALLRAGADVNARTADGDTPLHLVIPREMPPYPEDVGIDGIYRWVSERSRRENVHAPDEETSRRDAALIAVLVRGGADIQARGALDLTPLELAMRNGRPRLAAKLLELGADPPPRYGREGAVLPLVCDWANSGLFGIAPVATLQGCLDLGADASLRDRDGDTPFHALMKGLQWNHSFVPAAIATLLEAGADPDARNNAGLTPLHVASGRWGRPSVVESLVEAGADVNARDEKGRTPLHVAMREENSAVIARLLALGGVSTPLDSGLTASWVSCDSWGWPTFFRHATLDVITSCIEAGAEVNSRVPNVWGSWDPDSRRGKDYPGDHTPLHMAAAWSRDPAVVTLLIEAGADARARDRDGHTPLHYAALDNGNPAVIATLIDAGARVNAVAALGRTPLHQAASENPNPEVVAELLRRGADVTAKLAGGRTVVHEAARGNPNPAVLSALLESGAEVNARGGNEFERDPNTFSSHHSIDLTPWGGTNGLSEFAGSRTPLHEAAVANGNPEIVAALIEAGADVHARADLDRDYEVDSTPLYWAASANPDPVVLELLAGAGADVNAPAGSGRTPLHIAALRNPVAFPTLLELGADPTAPDREGRTPMDHAFENLWLQGWEVVRRWREERGNEPG